MNDSAASHRSAYKAMVVTICLLLLTLGLMKPVLRSHHFSPFYRTANSSRDALRHTPLDVTDQAPEVGTLELAREVARHLLLALDASHHLARPVAFDAELSDGPPGVFLNRRRLAPAHCGDPDPLI